MSWTNKDNLYKYCLSLFSVLKEGILNIPGIKHVTNGYTNDYPKLIKESSINWIWVCSYIQQKQVI